MRVAPARSHLRISSRPLIQHTWYRSNSTTSERSRKLPKSDQGSQSKASLWVWGSGFVAALGLYGGYNYYDRKRLQDSFVPYTLISREPVSSTSSIFRLRPRDQPEDIESYKQAWTQGIWNVHFKQPQIQILRAYTPLPPVDEKEKQNQKDLRFLIRHDPHGEVSSYLHRIPIGTDIELRGPNIEYQLTPSIRQVVFFAGGTGIAPALQVAHAMFEGQPQDEGESKVANNKRSLHILWANRKREDCLGGASDAPAEESIPYKASWSGLFSKPKSKVIPQIGQEKGVIVQELEQLKQKYPGQVTVEYFVNTEDTWIDEDVVFKTLSRFDDKDFSSGSPSLSEQRQILISGPSGFITYLAGPKEWRNGREEQGGVSKIIAHAIAQNPHHVKVWKV